MPKCVIHYTIDSTKLFLHIKSATRSSFKLLFLGLNNYSSLEHIIYYPDMLNF